MKKLYPIITLIPVIALLMMIFGFSAENADESSESSGSLIERLLEIIDKNYVNLSDDEKKAAVERFSYPIRKAAHFSEFAALAFFTALHLASVNHAAGRAAIAKIPLWAWLFSTACAASDEIHQLFVPGRAGMASDVLIDSAGALAGVLLFGAGSILVKNVKKNKV